MSHQVLNEVGHEPLPANQVASEDSRQTSSRPALRLVVPTIVLILYWTITEASYRIETGMFFRFVSRMLVLLVTLLFFLGWGFSRRHFTWRQRFVAFAIIFGTMFVAGAIGHPSTGTFATAMLGLPIVLSLSIGWLWFTRQTTPIVELSGIGFSSVVVFGVLSLLRWDGLDGRQRAEMSWRWTPSAEERFLQQSANRASTSTKVVSVLTESPEDWTSFRGGERQGIVTDVQFADWNVHAPKELWRQRVGPGWSSIVAVGDYLFTQEQRGDQEAVVCYESKSGNEVWAHTSKASGERFDDSLSGTGPRATPTFHENRIYAYGAKGRLECLDATTGEQLWAHPLFEMTGAKVPQWGSSSSPTVVDDLVVVFVGGPGSKGLMAFDRQSGEERWSSEAGTVSYSTPEVFNIAGERQILMHDETGFSGYEIADGKRLWQLPSDNGGSFQPMLQPHQITDDQIVINWNAGLLCCQIQKIESVWKVTQLWTTNRMKPSFNEFAIHKGFVYGLDDGILSCMELSTQKRRWKQGRYGFGQLLLLPEHDELLIITETGDVVRVAADPQEHRELARFTALHAKTWNHPILTRGKLVIRNSEEMACYEVDEHSLPH